MAESYPDTSTAAIMPPVVGLDGHSPIYQPDSRWTIFALYEIYTGQNGLQPNGKPYYVPKVNDYVIDPQTFTTYICKHIDPVTLIPRLEQIRPANMTVEFTENDILFGVSGNDPGTYRVYLDTSVIPYTLAVDARLKVAGSMVDHCKLFKGTDLGGSGLVISRVYDASGNVVTDKITLETVAINSHDNYAIKVVPVCHTNVKMNDGELVTAVFYDSLGKVVSKRQLLVENTGFIRGVNAEQKYVSHISLESPFLSPTLDHVIEYPLNIPINALNLMGKVHYSDGSILKLPVDGTKFRVFGLDQFVSSIIGQKIEIVLSYQLSSNEVAYGIPATENKCITEPYSIVVVEPNNSLAVKVFGYPVWVNDATGYKMQFWLFNLDRNICFDVTNYTRFAENTQAFDPRGFGYLQRKAITLNLRDVSAGFKPMIHTQLMDIVLNLPNGTSTPWTVSHESLGERPSYGDGLVAIAQIPDRTKFKIDSQISSQNEWLNRVYYATYPLIDRFKETKPPRPTHFEVIYNGRSALYSIDEWNSVLSLNTSIPVNSTIFIKFIKRQSEMDMQLSMAAMLMGI